MLGILIQDPPKPYEAPCECFAAPCDCSGQVLKTTTTAVQPNNSGIQTLQYPATLPAPLDFSTWFAQNKTLVFGIAGAGVLLLILSSKK